MLSAAVAVVMIIPSLDRSWLEREDALPVVLHADHRPAALLGLVQQRLCEGADLGVGQPGCAGVALGCRS